MRIESDCARDAVPAFHPCGREARCPHCTGTAATPFDWSFLDAVYCISLKERADRAESAARQFHRVGLCRYVQFYRPTRHPTKPAIDICESHQAVARHALAYGYQRVLVLEDDVRFSRWLGPHRLAGIARALRSLPTSWNVFYLGHWPLRVRFFSCGVLQTRSACTHAYVASRQMLAWLDRFEWQRDHLCDPWIGKGVDAPFARLPGVYATFPMVAFQSISISDHRVRQDRPRRIRRPWHLLTKTPIREWLISTLMRPNEMLVAGLAITRLLLRRQGDATVPLVGKRPE
jgi:hypothetical protein